MMARHFRRQKRDGCDGQRGDGNPDTCTPQRPDSGRAAVLRRRQRTREVGHAGIAVGGIER
jgi:hypothetical protein